MVALLKKSIADVEKDMREVQTAAKNSQNSSRSRADKVKETTGLTDSRTTTHEGATVQPKREAEDLELLRSDAQEALDGADEEAAASRAETLDIANIEAITALVKECEF